MKLARLLLVGSLVSVNLKLLNTEQLLKKIIACQVTMVVNSWNQPGIQQSTIVTNKRVGVLEINMNTGENFIT